MMMKANAMPEEDDARLLPKRIREAMMRGSLLLSCYHRGAGGQRLFIWQVSSRPPWC
jgi:hypothetical protein